MASTCRFIGGFVLVLATVAFALDQLRWVVPGAALAFVWLIAGQLAAVTAKAAPPPE